MDFPILSVSTNFNLSVSVRIYTLAYTAELLPQENLTCSLSFLLKYTSEWYSHPKETQEVTYLLSSWQYLLLQYNVAVRLWSRLYKDLLLKLKQKAAVVNIVSRVCFSKATGKSNTETVLAVMTQNMQIL